MVLRSCGWWFRIVGICCVGRGGFWRCIGGCCFFGVVWLGVVAVGGMFSVIVVGLACLDCPLYYVFWPWLAVLVDPLFEFGGGVVGVG